MTRWRFLLDGVGGFVLKYVDWPLTTVEGLAAAGGGCGGKAASLGAGNGAAVAEAAAAAFISANAAAGFTRGACPRRNSSTSLSSMSKRFFPAAALASGLEDGDGEGEGVAASGSASLRSSFLNGGVLMPAIRMRIRSPSTSHTQAGSKVVALGRSVT